MLFPSPRGATGLQASQKYLAGRWPHILEYTRLTFELVFPEGATLPYWLGSTFRGGLGQHLPKAVCQPPDCPYCREAPCLFRDVYLPRRAKRGHAQPPKPLILVPPFFGQEKRLEPGARLELEALILDGYTKSFLQLLLGMIAFGEAGIGPERHYGANRFQVAGIRCLETGGQVLQGNKISLDTIATRDICDIQPLPEAQYTLKLKTPFTGAYLPLTTHDLVRLIRRRLILLVNEYGTGEHLPEIKPEEAEGRLTVTEAKRHTLQRRSTRSTKQLFYGWTGTISIDTRGLSQNARWILAAGAIIGMGPDPTFGSGFYTITQNNN